MIDNEELKKKIVEVIDNWADNAVKTKRSGASVYDPYNAAELADALISAGIGDVKDLQAQVNSLEITNIALQAGYDDAEKDRLYWVNKYKEAEHRAEVAEDVIDEFVERLKESLQEFVKRDYEDSVPYYNADCEQIDNVIEKLAAEMRQEVEK